ncbi:MAG: helix-turn-helix transcriptional regulator [Actinobacteria bacterium]|nr:helix-turn-helix transcriptional regulator [Actinomycetota bacterium]
MPDCRPRPHPVGGQHDARANRLPRRRPLDQFKDEEVTYRQFVLDLRLALAYRKLRLPRYAHRTISSIANDTGFGDLSYFNRAFRRRYGITPSDARLPAVKYVRRLGAQPLQPRTSAEAAPACLPRPLSKPADPCRQMQLF